MQEVQDTKMFFYFDESGEQTILGHRGKNLLEKGLVSKTFSVGYVQTANPNEFAFALESLRKEILADDYYKNIPSIKNLKNGFHANKDCHEIRDKVFHLIKKFDFEAYIIVARKSEDLFRKKFNLNNKELYKFLVSELLKNRVHLYKEIDIYFSEMGNVISKHSMAEALNEATKNFQRKWGKENKNNIQIFVQQPSQIPMLQVIDYVLWAVFRVYEHGEFRYFDFLRDKIKLVHDIFDIKANPYYGAFYSDKNPLDEKKLSPLSS